MIFVCKQMYFTYTGNTMRLQLKKINEFAQNYHKKSWTKLTLVKNL